MSSDSSSDPILAVVRALPWIEDPAPNRTTSVVNLGMPAIGLTVAPLPHDPQLRERCLDDLKQIFSPETVEELTKHEEKVFARLQQDSSAAVHLLTDPVNTLKRMGVKLTPRALAELQNVRQKLITPQALQALAGIKELSIKIDPGVGGN